MTITINPKPEDTKSCDLALIVIKGGFPHSDIAGSKLIRSSPTLFAAYHVLHRLCMPRHPPDALKTLDHSHCLYSFISEQALKKQKQTTVIFFDFRLYSSNLGTHPNRAAWAKS